MLEKQFKVVLPEGYTLYSFKQSAQIGTGPIESKVDIGLTIAEKKGEKYRLRDEVILKDVRVITADFYWGPGNMSHWIVALAVKNDDLPKIIEAKKKGSVRLSPSSKPKDIPKE